MAEFTSDQTTALPTIVLFSNRNIFDISTWTLAPWALIDGFDSFEWPLEPMLVSVWMLQLPFMLLAIDGSSSQRQRTFLGEECIFGGY